MHIDDFISTATDTNENQIRAAGATSQLTFSIITVTYNRARLLERVFRSLEAQTFRDFEWIVVDDGSTDDTVETVKKLANTAPFSVRYFRQINAGKLVGVNRGMTLARGYLIGIQDDDDWYLPNALERCWSRWKEIPEKTRHEYVGLAALAAHPGGGIVGTKFPEDVFDSDSIQIRSVHRVKGDKKSFIRAEVLRQFPFPETLTRHTPEEIVWNRMALLYKTRFVNDVWSYVDYQANGMSATRCVGKLADAHGMWISASELLASGKPMRFWFSLRTQSTFVRFVVHDRTLSLDTLRTVLERASPLGLILGLLLYTRDRCRGFAQRIVSSRGYLTLRKMLTTT